MLPWLSAVAPAKKAKAAKPGKPQGAPAQPKAVKAGPPRRFAAVVRQIAPRAVKTNNVTSFEVKLSLLDPAPELRIGMTADIDFQTGQLQARTLVPTVAIVTETGRPGVLRVGKQQQPTFQAVELGASSGKDTQILSGLEPNTRVFIDLPPKQLVPGMCARLIRCFYGSRVAPARWEAFLAEQLKLMGFTRGKASTCCYQHATRDLRCIVHGEDFVFV